MRCRLIKSLLLVFVSTFPFCFLNGQQTVGLFSYDQHTSPGYNLLFPLQSTATYLMDNCGHQINQWESAFLAGNVAYLLENGDLLRAARVNNNSTFFGGGAGGRVERYNWEGELQWYYEYSSTDVLQHHDIEWLPNGNVLILAWEYVSQADAIAAGRDPSTMVANQLWPDHIVEVAPIDSNDGMIVWEWHMWDHIIQDFDPTKSNYGVVAEHPERLNVNFGVGNGGADWMHSNAIDYHLAFDQIMISSRSTNEIYVIDHSTTTLEASMHTGGNYGKGGDILFRWGNPAAYDQGDSSDQQLFGQHDPHWIPGGLLDEGKIMIFNNGAGRVPDQYSSIDIITPVHDTAGFYALSADSTYGPEQAEWTYTADVKTSFYSEIISGAQRLSNGNTLICNGSHGRVFEIDAQKDIVWDYISPVIKTGILSQGDAIPGGASGSDNLLFRFYRYAPDYPGLIGKDLTPGNLIELNPFPDTCGLISAIDKAKAVSNHLFPNPSDHTLFIDGGGASSLEIFSLEGKRIYVQKEQYKNLPIDVSGWEAGVYFYRLNGEGIRKLILF